jgi:hypothetical protein
MLIGSGPTYAASPGTLSITVHPDQLGNQLRPGFVGLSFGAATVAQDGAGSPVEVQKVASPELPPTRITPVRPSVRR